MTYDEGLAAIIKLMLENGMYINDRHKDRPASPYIRIRSNYLEELDAIRDAIGGGSTTFVWNDGPYQPQWAAMYGKYQIYIDGNLGLKVMADLCKIPVFKASKFYGFALIMLERYAYA